MKTAVIYARVSTGKQEKEGFSIPAQIKFLKEYAKNKLFDVKEMFVEAETAKKAGRKQFNKMLAYISEHKIDAILVEKTDRIYRNFKDYVTLDDFKELEIHLVKENTILSKNSSSNTKFLHGVKVLMAKNYIDNLSEEVTKGLREKVSQGIYPQKAPVGYINTKNEAGVKIIAIDPIKSVFIRQLFELYASGTYSIEQIRKMLFKAGLVNRKGKSYSKARLLFVLKDVFYIGKFTYKGVVYDGKHEPIVDVDLFNKVQKLFNQSKARSHDVEFAYAGLIKCGHCGCQLTAELKKGKYVYYHCTGKRGGECKKDYIREEELDKVFENLISKIPNPDNGLFEDIKKAIKEMRCLKADYEETSVEAIQKQINRLSMRIDNLYTDKLDGNITEEYWQTKHNAWYKEKDMLITRLRTLNEASKTFDEGTNLLENFCKHAPQEFFKANAKKKQQILKMIGSNFIYKDKKLSVELSSVFDLLINSSFSKNGAGDEARTRDILLGKEAFYHWITPANFLLYDYYTWQILKCKCFLKKNFTYCFNF